MTPDHVGPYRIEKKLGSGGMGTVYLGVHRETDQQAAVKVLPASLAREEGFIERFNREIAAIEKLSNPYVVALYDHGQENETYYYAMEYVPGQTLTQLIREKKRIPWRDAIDYAVQLCAALKAAHDAGVIHRDLKPSNILVTEKNKIKLLDFGVAQVFAAGKLTKTGGIIGTAEYMSPEQAQGKRATKKSDIYSLGAVMYVMVTGRPPFSGKTSLEVIQKHKFSRFDSPRTIIPDLPHWLDEVICACLEKEPDDRFPDAFVLSLRLKEIVRKVEMSQQQDTFAHSGTDATAETMVGEGANSIGGTVMRDLIRAEIDDQSASSPLERYLENIWVLVGLLVLLILGGVWWFLPNQMSAEDQYAAGVKLYDQGPAYYEQARDHYFLPLLESDPEQWNEQLQPMLVDIEIHELKKKFGLTKLSRKLQRQRDDVYRFLNLSRKYYELGDHARAEEILQNLTVLIESRQEYQPVYLAVENLLLELKTEKASADLQAGTESEIALLPDAMARADQCLMNGELEKAKSIWQSIITLYDGESSAESYVQLAKEKLATNYSQQMETIETSYDESP